MTANGTPTQLPLTPAMLILGFPAQAFGTNCYVVAPAPGERCVIVDPGIGVAEQLDAVLQEHRLTPAAVLLTHGHLDHTFSVTPVCGSKEIPAYIQAGDAHLLKDPMAGLSADLRALFGGRLEWTEPADVVVMGETEKLSVAGLEITVDHAPGHTPGSAAFRLPLADTEVSEVMLSGDLLFAGSIGRTDLPGGDHQTMLRSLESKALSLPDDVVVLPGHGPATTIGEERRTNPFLQSLGAAASSAAAPRATRGL